MRNTTNIELWVAINEDGDFSVTTDESNALETLANEQGGYHARVIKIELNNVELPGQDVVTIDAPSAQGSVAMPQATDTSDQQDASEAAE